MLNDEFLYHPIAERSDELRVEIRSVEDMNASALARAVELENHTLRAFENHLFHVALRHHDAVGREEQTIGEIGDVRKSVAIEDQVRQRLQTRYPAVPAL